MLPRAACVFQPLIAEWCRAGGSHGESDALAPIADLVPRLRSDYRWLALPGAAGVVDSCDLLVREGTTIYAHLIQPSIEVKPFRLADCQWGVYVRDRDSVYCGPNRDSICEDRNGVATPYNGQMVPLLQTRRERGLNQEDVRAHAWVIDMECEHTACESKPPFVLGSCPFVLTN